MSNLLKVFYQRGNQIFRDAIALDWLAAQNPFISGYVKISVATVISIFLV
jgi:hypothetical protein